MAHKFETGVFYGDKAWHSLGTTLDAGDARRRSVVDTMSAAGLDWRVEKMPLMVSNEATVPAEIRGAGILGSYGVFRLSDWSHLGTVGDRYECLQNADMFQWFQPFLDAGVAEFETAGSLDSGRIPWVLARMTIDDLEVSTGDSIRPYILLTSSHDGKFATRAGFTPIRVVCWNTLSASVQDSRSQLLRVRHTSSQAQSLNAIRQAMDLLAGEFRATVDQYRKLQSMPISRSDLRKYVKLVFDMPEDDADLSGRSRNMLDRIVTLATHGTGQQGDLNAWSAYQGVTHYLSHERNKDASKRVQSLWLGDSAQVNARAFELALTL